MALFAVLTKAVVDVVGDGVVALLRAPELYAWIAAALAGMIFQQSSFRAGSLTASLPTSVVAKPLVGSVLGVIVLGETLDTAGPRAFVLAAGVVLVMVATVALARGEAATISEEASEKLSKKASKIASKKAAESGRDTADPSRTDFLPGRAGRSA